MKLFLSLLILTFSVSFIKAQENPHDNRYTPPARTIFNFDPKASDPNAVDERKNAIKFMATMVVRQQVSFFYEREIVKGITLTAGIGFAFGEDYFQKAYLQVFSGWDYGNTKIFADEILNNSTYQSSTPLLMVGGRFYFGDKIFDATYFELNYRNQSTTYDLEEQFIRDRNYRSTDPSVDFKMHAFSMGIGFPGLFGKNKHFTHDVFLGMGIKFISYDEIVEKEVTFNGNLGTTRILEKSGARMTAKIIPSISLGYSFGFAF